MPFRSEKQRRFLWSQHPEIAHRWAHEYPKQGKLPMYAHKTKGENSPEESEQETPSKEAALIVLEKALLGINSKAAFAKKSESILKEVNIPHSSKPVAAGDEHVTAKRDALPGCSEKKPLPRPNVLKMFNLEQQKQAHELAGILRKFSAVINPGKNIRALLSGAYSQFAEPQSYLRGINFQQISQAAQKAKADAAYIAHRNMVFGPPEQPKQKQPAPVATYPGTKPKTPNVMSSNLASSANPAMTTIERNGPLKVENGQIAANQVTGNSGGLAGGITPGQKTQFLG